MERAWLPEREGYSLYIRPFMFSSGHSIGIGRPTSTTIAIMLSPVGPYFQTGTPWTRCWHGIRLHSNMKAAFKTAAQLIASHISQHAPCQ